MRRSPKVTIIALATLGFQLTGCAGLVAAIPDAQARAEARAEKRREEVLALQRRRRAAAAPQPGGEDRSVAEYLAEGDRYRNAGDYSKAFLSYMRAHRQNRDHPAPPLRVAFLALRQNPAQAEQLFREFIEKHPGESILHTGLGIARLAEDDLEGAREALGRAAQLDPRSALAKSTLGVVYDRLQRHGEAQAQYLAAHALRPGDVHVLNNLGVSYLMTGDYERAVQVLREALALGSRDPATHNNLGLALGFLGREDEALEAFRSVGSEGDAYNNLGYVLFVKGDYRGATRYFERALLSNDTDEARVIRNLVLVEKAQKGTF